MEDTSHRSATWLVTEGGILTLDQMKKIEPVVNGGGTVYRAQVVGYYDQGGPDARIEAILDATKTPSRVVFWRDITHLGRGYPRDLLGRDVE
jgi:hypothetical protein